MIEVERIIDKIAEKLGVAANSLKPLAEETLHQVQSTGVVMIVSGIAIFFLCASLSIWLISEGYVVRKAKKDPAGYYLSGGLVVFVGIITCAPLVILGLFRYTAPILHLLDSLGVTK